MKNKILVFRPPEKHWKRIQNLIKSGDYKTKTEIINEALRHFFWDMDRQSNYSTRKVSKK